MASKANLKVRTVGEIVADLDAINPRAVIGDNKPPEPTPYEVSVKALADLKLTATNWLDGAAIENQAQADDVAKLVESARKVEAEADAARAAEKKPHDEAAAAVQARWKKPIVDEANRIFKLGKLLTTGWLNKLDAEQRERERIAKIAADDIAMKATIAAREAAGSTNLDDHDRAEALIAQSEAAGKEVRQAVAAKPQAFGGGARALGLRTYWSAKIVDRRAALGHYATTAPDELEAWIQSMADRDARGDRGTVPGVEFYSERRA